MPWLYSIWVLLPGVELLLTQGTPGCVWVRAACGFHWPRLNQGWNETSQVRWSPEARPHLAALWGKTRKHPLYSPPSSPLIHGVPLEVATFHGWKNKRQFLEHLIYVISWVVKHHFSQFTLCWSLTCVSNIKGRYLKCSLISFLWLQNGLPQI